MIWLFERGEEVVRLETRIDAGSGEYVVEITWASRPREVLRFRDQEAFRSRLVALEQQLAQENWTQLGSPEILPSGWRGPIPH